MHGAETKSVVNGFALTGLEKIEDYGPTDLVDLKFRAVQHIWRAMIGGQDVPDNGVDIAFRILSLPKE